MLAQNCNFSFENILFVLVGLRTVEYAAQAAAPAGFATLPGTAYQMHIKLTIGEFLSNNQ